ncbi:MAG: hypothetical protein AB1633_10815, partial [Elusimicrobiota bacterium]
TTPFAHSVMKDTLVDVGTKIEGIEKRDVKKVFQVSLYLAEDIVYDVREDFTEFHLLIFKKKRRVENMGPSTSGMRERCMGGLQLTVPYKMNTYDCGGNFTGFVEREAFGTLTGSVSYSSSTIENRSNTKLEAFYLDIAVPRFIQKWKNGTMLLLDYNFIQGSREYPYLNFTLNRQDTSVNGFDSMPNSFGFFYLDEKDRKHKDLSHDISGAVISDFLKNKLRLAVNASASIKDTVINTDQNYWTNNDLNLGIHGSYKIADFLGIGANLQISSREDSLVMSMNNQGMVSLEKDITIGGQTSFDKKDIFSTTVYLQMDKKKFVNRIANFHLFIERDSTISAGSFDSPSWIIAKHNFLLPYALYELYDSLLHKQSLFSGYIKSKTHPNLLPFPMEIYGEFRISAGWDSPFFVTLKENSWKPELRSRNASENQRTFKYMVDSANMMDSSYVDASGGSFEKTPDSLARSIYCFLYGAGFCHKISFLTVNLECQQKISLDKSKQNKISSYLPRYQYNHSMYETALRTGLEINFRYVLKFWGGFSHVILSYSGDPLMEDSYIYNKNGAYKVKTFQRKYKSSVTTCSFGVGSFLNDGQIELGTGIEFPFRYVPISKFSNVEVLNQPDFYYNLDIFMEERLEKNMRISLLARLNF